MFTDRQDERVHLRRAHEYRGEEVVAIHPLPTADSWLSRSECAVVRREWIEFFSQPTSISDLELRRANDEVLGALVAQHQLVRLTVNGGPFTDLGPIARLSRLESLRLDATRVTDLAPLVALVALRELEIENALRLRDYSPLGRVSSLRSLSVHRSFTGARTKADSLDFLSALDDLEELRWDPRVASRDFSAVLALTSAVFIGITPTKGMSPTMVDLEWSLPGVQAAEKRASEQRIPVVSADGEVAILTRDITGRSSWEPPRPDEIVTVMDFEPVARPSGLVTGTTVRAFSSTPRTRKETFLIRVDGWSDAASPALSPDQVELSRFQFAGPAAGPLIVWDSAVDIADDPESVDAYFDGNADRPVFADLPDGYVGEPTEPDDEDPWLWGVRALVRASGSIREWLLLVNMPTPLETRWRDAAIHAIAMLGGEVVAGPELALRGVWALGHAPEAFTIRRRSSQPTVSYVAKYGFKLPAAE